MDERMNLLKCLAAADFACVDTRLFLDTHPYDKEALAAACEYEQRAQCLRERYEQLYGPLTAAAAARMSATSCGCTADMWISDPWPWDCVVERRR